MQRSFNVSVDLSADVLSPYISCSNRQSKNARLLYYRGVSTIAGRQIPYFGTRLGAQTLVGREEKSPQGIELPSTIL